MQRYHITHLITPYLEGQLSPSQRARIVNHVRECTSCRATLARQERLASDVTREFPAVGYAPSGQLSDVFAGVMQDVQAQRWQDRLPLHTWLPGVTVAAVMLLVIAVVLPLISTAEVRVEAAPLQNLPVSTASPTRGVVGTDEARGALNPASNSELVEPQATVAFISDSARDTVRDWENDSGATPAPVPGVFASPEARGASSRK